MDRETYELGGCPNCGSRWDLQFDYYKRSGVYVPYCNNCGTYGMPGRTPNEAIGYWDLTAGFATQTVELNILDESFDPETFFEYSNFTGTQWIIEYMEDGHWKQIGEIYDDDDLDGVLQSECIEGYCADQIEQVWQGEDPKGYARIIAAYEKGEDGSSIDYWDAISMYAVRYTDMFADVMWNMVLGQSFTYADIPLRITRTL